jgi:L-asparaginase
LSVLAIAWTPFKFTYINHFGGNMGITQIEGQLPIVAVLPTRGTIACRQNQSKGGYEAVLTCQDLVAAAPAIRKVAQVRVEQICNISSSNMTAQIWVRLSSRVSHLLTMPNIAGVVITHGTDTPEETAFFLDLTVTGSKPVILVGADRPSSDCDSDGPRNFLDAIRVAVSPEGERDTRGYEWTNQFRP